MVLPVSSHPYLNRVEQRLDKTVDRIGKLGAKHAMSAAATRQRSPAQQQAARDVASAVHFALDQAEQARAHDRPAEALQIITAVLREASVQHGARRHRTFPVGMSQLLERRLLQTGKEIARQVGTDLIERGEAQPDLFESLDALVSHRQAAGSPVFVNKVESFLIAANLVSPADLLRGRELSFGFARTRN